MQVGPYTLRPHQVNAVQQARASVAALIATGQRPRVVIQGVCGFGKTLVSSALMAAAVEKGKRVGFIVRGRQLVFQKSDKLADCLISHAVVMADCTGEIAIPYAMPYRSDQPPQCSVVSKDTYESLLRNKACEPFDWDLLIVDECHEGMSESWLDLLRKSRVVIGLSATPARSNGRGLGDFYNDLVIVSTHQELIDAGYLVPPRVFDPWGVDTRGLKASSDTGEYAERDIESRCFSEELVGSFVSEWWRLAEGRTTAFYASSVAHSMAQARQFREGDGTLLCKPLAWEHIDAETPQKERKAIYKALASGGLQGVSNYGVLRTGFDCPAISCIQLGVSMASLVAFLQTVGRGARPHAGKQDFLLIDHGHNVHRHGWPQEDREWSLDPAHAFPSKSDATPSDKPKDRTCAKCSTVFKASLGVCPNCGHQKAREERMVRTAEGQLVEVKAEEIVPPVREKRVTCEAQKMVDKLVFPAMRSRRPGGLTFNQIRRELQKKTGGRLRFGEKEITGRDGVPKMVTTIIDAKTNESWICGNVPPPQSHLWDARIKTVDKERLQYSERFAT